MISRCMANPLKLLVSARIWGAARYARASIIRQNSEQSLKKYGRGHPGLTVWVLARSLRLPLVVLALPSTWHAASR